MGRNTFDLEQVLKNQDEDFNRKTQAPRIMGDYEIEATGLDGWMSYRYQYKVDTHDYFGYAETIEEARGIILKAQAR